MAGDVFRPREARHLDTWRGLSTPEQLAREINMDRQRGEYRVTATDVRSYFGAPEPPKRGVCYYFSRALSVFGLSLGPEEDINRKLAKGLEEEEY